MKVRFVEGLAKNNKDIMAKETLEFIENNPEVEVVAIKVEGFNLFFSPDEVEVVAGGVQKSDDMVQALKAEVKDLKEKLKTATVKKPVELEKGGENDNGNNPNSQPQE